MLLPRSFLAIAFLMLAGCASSTTPSPPQIPPLSPELAADCAVIPDQTTADYDAWLQWDVTVLKDYADCAARHHATVQSWPTTQSQPAPKKTFWERNFGG